jgi:outer membrane protein OmpA-like peptidoglycan-associated protein
MKKLTLLFTVLALSHFGNAQVRVGLAGGFHSATASPEFYKADFTIRSNVTQFNSGHFGLLADVPLGVKGMYFQTGLSYFGRGQKQSVELDTIRTNTFLINSTLKLNYLDIPLNFVYKYPITKGVKLLVGAGPQASIFFSGSETIATMDKFKTFKEEKDEDLLVGRGESRYKTSFFSLNALAGFEIRNVSLTANYATGLTNFYQKEEADFRHKSFGATLALFLYRTKPESIPQQPKDTDLDGVDDSIDQCPSDAGTILTNGCPDNDGDGVANNKDQCPDVAGLLKYKGCPIPDTDGDGVNDELDQCPNKAGTIENKGCPVVVKEEPKVDTPQLEVQQEVVDQINLNAKRIDFKFSQAELKTSSYPILDEIVALLKDKAVKIKVEGHSSLEGNAKTNLKLSQDRAENVKKYLVSKGIAAERITATGYGSTRPLVKGSSEKANMQNRRVEITIDQ